MKQTNFATAVKFKSNHSQAQAPGLNTRFVIERTTHHPLGYLKSNSKNCSTMKTPAHTQSQLAWAWLCLVLLCNLLSAPLQARANPAVPAGQVTLVIGQAHIQRGTSNLSTPSQGADIFAGDVIQTSPNGHLHIKFIDGALVSVRPGSVFHIQEFNYNPAQPTQSTVRFNLETGEVRAISGNAAQSARERFRLNTPLAAIGVKGTDFLTQASPFATRVTVNQGAIVMAPLDATCLASGLGACTGARARELRADMGSLTLVYQLGAADPSLQTTPSNSDGAKLQQLNQQFNTIKANAQAVTPTEAMPPASRMVWGRWANTAVPGDALTIPFLQAMDGNEVTIGDGYYFLFRQPGVPNTLPTLTRQVDFSLQAASAYYRTPANTLTTASVLGGVLGINFASQTYNTSLTLATPGISNHLFAMTGNINTANGIFLGGSGNLAGALALDATQAGYLFSSPAGGGTFTGATLWGRAK